MVDIERRSLQRNESGLRNYIRLRLASDAGTGWGNKKKTKNALLSRAYDEKQGVGERGR